MRPSLFVALTIACSGDSSDDKPTDTGPTETTPTDTAPVDTGTVATFALGGSATGVDGAQVQLRLDTGEQITVSRDGSFTFPTPLAEGTPWTVTLVTQPTCPVRACTVTDGTGVMPAGDVTSIALDCVEPSIVLASHSWTELTLRLTDDVWSIPDGGTAKPRVVTGNLGSLSGDDVAIDRTRELLYVADNSSVHVYDDLRTIDGAVDPVRTFSLDGASKTTAVEIDESRDRAYFRDDSSLYVLDGVSKASGTVMPTAAIPIFTEQFSGGAVELDPTRDVLYVGSYYEEAVAVFDSASAITSASTPDRTITWDLATGFNGPASNGIAVDPCTDRLYLGSNSATPDGNNLAVFANASTLDGAVDLDDDSVARIGGVQVAGILLDEQDRLYTVPDNGTSLMSIWQGASSLSGDVSTKAYTMNELNARGYGMDWIYTDPDSAVPSR